jgi:hypothetical protein
MAMTASPTSLIAMASGDMPQQPIGHERCDDIDGQLGRVDLMYEHVVRYQDACPQR